jgi:hypothetical protein
MTGFFPPVDDDPTPPNPFRPLPAEGARGG